MVRTPPAGRWPISASQSAAGRVARACSISTLRASRLRERPEGVAKRSSSSRSERPITRQKSAKRRSVAMAR